jgi:predicted nucleic acid-binding protein
MHAIVDTGPLVAFFDRAEQHHHWIAERIEELEAPLLVCEPVLAEAMYLLARHARAQDALFELLQKWRDPICVPDRGACRSTAQFASKIGTHQCH